MLISPRIQQAMDAVIPYRDDSMAFEMFENELRQRGLLPLLTEKVLEELTRQRQQFNAGKSYDGPPCHLTSHW